MSEESKEIVVQDKFMMPVADVQTAMSRYQAFKDFVGGILKENTDFGSIPGSDKPALLKPGAEKLGAFFGLSPKFTPIEVINDWTGKDHNGEPFFFYHYKCQLFRGDYFAGESFGSCNSWEKKYRYRWENELNLPANTDLSKYECKDGAISEFAFAIDKAETTGKYGKPAEYWQKFKDAIDNGTARHFMRKTKKGDEMDAWEIGGKLYAIPNKDVADQVNTIDKMAQKRAFIAAILVVTNASEYFTQDLEDYTYEQIGEVIEGEVIDDKGTQKKATVGNKRPYSAEELKIRLDKFQTMYKNKWDDDQIELYRKIIVINLEKCYAGKGSDMKRHEALSYLFGNHSSKDLTPEQIYALHEWLSPKQDSGGDWNPDSMAVTEAQTLLTAARKEAGQMELTEEE
jgi:hypothetical protein